MEFDFKILEQKFQQLPSDVQAALSSVEISAEIQEIAKKNGLLIDQESILYDMISYTMLGLIPSRDFVSHLAKEAAISEKIASAIAEEVNSTIFSKIRASMQEIQKMHDEKQNSDAISSNNSRPQLNMLMNQTAPRELTDATLTTTDRERMLAHLENPTGKPVPEVTPREIPVPENKVAPRVATPTPPVEPIQPVTAFKGMPGITTPIQPPAPKPTPEVSPREKVPLADQLMDAFTPKNGEAVAFTHAKAPAPENLPTETHKVVTMASFGGDTDLDPVGKPPVAVATPTPAETPVVPVKAPPVKPIVPPVVNVSQPSQAKKSDLYREPVE